MAPEVIAEREKYFLEEVTPMMVTELIGLAAQHELVICEGDIDYELIVPLASHAVYLLNCGIKFDWFDRPDHSLDPIRNRTDWSEEEKQTIIDHAYRSAAVRESVLPDWVSHLDVKYIRWDDGTSIEQTAKEVEEYFAL